MNYIIELQVYVPQNGCAPQNGGFYSTKPTEFCFMSATVLSISWDSEGLWDSFPVVEVEQSIKYFAKFNYASNYYQCFFEIHL